MMNKILLLMLNNYKVYILLIIPSTKYYQIGEVNWLQYVTG